MNQTSVRQLANELEDRPEGFVVWLALDLFEHWLERNHDAAGTFSTIVSQMREIVYENLCNDGALTISVKTPTMKRVRRMASEQRNRRGAVGELAKAAYDLTEYGDPHSAIRAITRAARQLESDLVWRQFCWLDQAWQLAGPRSIHSIHDGEYPISITDFDQVFPINRYFIFTPGDIQRTNWIAVMFALCLMWIAVAIIKLISAFV